MSSDALLPITPARFAAALQELPLTTVHLKLFELRSQIALLDYSNEQLRPFALGEATAPGTAPGEPDSYCAEAIRENEAVIERMQERIQLVRAEVEERRGLSWSEFQSKEEAEAQAARAKEASARAAATTNGVNGNPRDHEGQSVGAESSGEGRAQATERHSAWSDGTFTAGTIRAGRVDDSIDPDPRPGGGGTLTDEELRARLEAQMGPLGDEGDDGDQGGLHL